MLFPTSHPFLLISFYKEFLALICFCFFLAVIPLKNTPKIVGGQNTTVEHLPYQASLRYYGMHICGGVIINRNTILSGAHCFDTVHFISAYTIRVGSTFRNTGGDSINVESITKHPEFNGTTYYFDIAIVKLEQNLIFGKSAQPVRLPRINEKVVPGAVAIVSGWGALAVIIHNFSS